MRTHTGLLKVINDFCNVSVSVGAEPMVSVLQQIGAVDIAEPAKKALDVEGDEKERLASHVTVRFDDFAAIRKALDDASGAVQSAATVSCCSCDHWSVLTQICAC